MRAARLLSALMLLQSRPRVSTREIAGRLGISQRTAHRDMESLCEAGIPLVAIRGAQGGWELMPGWRARIPALSEPELRALVLGRPSAAAERALDKIVAALPEPLQSEAASIRATVYIDPEGWWPGSEDISSLPLIQDAVAGRRRVTFLYRPPNRPVESRTVEPLGTVFKQGSWYVVARAPAGLRTYRISRMSDVVPLAVGFDRPPKFDLAAYWKESTVQLQSRRPEFCATLAVSPDAASMLARWRVVVPSAKRGHRKLAPGWTIVDALFESSGQALFIAQGLGSSAELLAPEHLRARLAINARELAALYPER